MLKNDEDEDEDDEEEPGVHSLPAEQAMRGGE